MADSDAVLLLARANGPRAAHRDLGSIATAPAPGNPALCKTIVLIGRTRPLGLERELRWRPCVCGLLDAILAAMSTVTIALSDPLDAAVRERMAAMGVQSTEQICWRSSSRNVRRANSSRFWRLASLAHSRLWKQIGKSACGRRRQDSGENRTPSGGHRTRSSGNQLSSIDVHSERIGYEAAALLARLMRGTRPPRRPLIFPTRGRVLRQSTDVSAVTDPHVLKAARLIRDHVGTPIAIEELLVQVPVSRSALFRQFKERPKEQLRSSTLPMAAVAERAGYNEARQFIVMFRRLTGTTPLRYRKQALAHRASRQSH
jgi:AraC-like DNA-binding protein